MTRGVYIGKRDHGDFDLISAGDYINPLTTTFRLKDLQRTVSITRPLWLIINDIEVEYIKVEISGHLTLIRAFLSWDQVSWSRYLVLEENINAIGTTILRKFYIKVLCDDFLQYFNLRGEGSYKQLKLKLVYV